MKLLKISILSVLVFFISVSCEKQLDINTNPLVASSADPNVVLPFVIVQYSNRKVTELGTRTLDVPQHLSACFNSPRNGATSIFLTGNTWGMMYTQVLGNLALVEADAKEAGLSSNNVAAIAVILKGMIFYELTSIWEDVPFSEALNGTEFPSPSFDSQEAILRGVVDVLDEGMQLIDGMPSEGIVNVSQGDLIYQGDMGNWRRFANSLKIRVLMLLRNKDTSVDSQIIAALGQPFIETNAQAAILEYYDTPGQQNGFQQLNEAFFGTSNEITEVFAPGEPLWNLIALDADPRDGLFLFDPNGLSPTNGSFADVDEAVISDNVIRNDLPQMWLLPAEISLYRAELALKGAATGDDAKTMYDLGVTQALSWWGQDIPGAQKTLTDAEISAFVGTLPASPSLDDVHEQQYLETFMRPVVAWNHVRRTNVPVLSPPSASTITSILKRFNYPPDEVASNPKTPINPRTDAPMWFEN
jgi:hypothetical protein